jgi:hypothetical protein
MYFLKKIIMIAIIGACIYFLMTYHYIIVNNSVKMLKKSEFTLKYTFFNTKGKTLQSILTVQELWDDGIGDLLLEQGKITEEEYYSYQRKMETSDEESY